MIRSLTIMMELAAYSADGLLGKIDDVYFDEYGWTVRYFLTRTRNEALGDAHLLSPIAMQAIDEEFGALRFNQTARQIEAAPRHDTEVPISRRYESAYYAHYGWPCYWVGSRLWAQAASAFELFHPDTDTEVEIRTAIEDSNDDPKLRSTNEILTYELVANDETRLGNIADLLVDEWSWQVRFLAVTLDRLMVPTRNTLLPPAWISRIDWHQRALLAELPPTAIEEAPKYRQGEPLIPELESATNDHYNAYLKGQT